MDIKSLHDIFLNSNGVSTDTRKIVPGCLFVAIKGERYDANTFAEEAISKGAGHVIIDNGHYAIAGKTSLVEDSLSALQQLAQFHRRYLGLKIVALTGSNGKTTTKELIHSVLSQKFNCKATVGNLNNHIGVPLTLLSFDTSTEIGIVEMGANHQKEIEFLCRIAEPDFGYITNFGKAHLEGFGGVEGVIKGKSEMYDYLRDHHKTVFVNVDDAIQTSKSSGIKQFSFGIDKKADLCVNSIAADPFVTVTVGNTEIKSQLIGAYNAPNICAAVAIGSFFDVPFPSIKKAVESYIPENNRSQIIRAGGLEIILDAYNANPSSMAAAIDNLANLSAPRKTAVLGDMFEMGPESATEHSAVIDKAIQSKNVDFIFVGKDFFSNRKPAANIAYCETFDELVGYLQKRRLEGTLLIKGSRGMALERTLDLLWQ